VCSDGNHFNPCKLLRCHNRATSDTVLNFQVHCYSTIVQSLRVSPCFKIILSPSDFWSCLFAVWSCVNSSRTYQPLEMTTLQSSEMSASNCPLTQCHIPGEWNPQLHQWKSFNTYIWFKTLFIIPTDAHYYKIIEILKQFKITILAPTCFGSRTNHQQGADLCLAKTTKWSFCSFS
jgi:hypothetical protein